MAELTSTTRNVGGTLTGGPTQTTGSPPTNADRFRASSGTGPMVPPRPGYSGAGPALGGAGFVPGMMMGGKETIRFQPWLTLETATGGPGEIVQPASQWLNGAHVPTYNLQIQVPYLSGCTLYIESSPTAEGPWAEALAISAYTNTMAVLSSEGGSARFSGYVRWRVGGTAPWQICFQIKATPGVSVAGTMGTPKQV